MSARYYGLLLAIAASLSLPLAGCGLELKKEYPAGDPRNVAPAAALPANPAAAAASAPTASPAPAAAAPAPAAPAPQKAARVASAERDDTDMTLWTVLGLAKRDAERNLGPQTGAGVSPVLWEATLDTLKFAGTSSEDPITGVVVSKWYAPAAKPNERLRATVFILSRALRSDSLSVTVERQESTGGGWRDTPVAKDVVTALESAILQRARQIHAERYRNTMYN